MNNQLGEIDDSIFLQIVKSGIKNASAGDKKIYDELIAHAIDLYTAEWLRMAAEDEEEPNLEFEKTEAKTTFMNYFDGDV